ncbi:hypothetical protein FM037_20225 [Shewanella psychropiezotolerans]|uniref:Uncharacterized protein n=1 Tax=Shewanella psychropiezotolerans TaxID=2593655 RepID=A0ABX5X1B6_9GAMM|nr:hypothetical protein [Shewanella psychropiezotolerans]QDO85140.1 hypothetical protein FM037_20225 [Shewanella psychropiezotolerans]
MHHFSRRKHIKHVHRSAHIRRMRYFTSQHTSNYIPVGLAEQVQENDLSTSDDLVAAVDKTG